LYQNAVLMVDGLYTTIHDGVEAPPHEYCFLHLHDPISESVAEEKYLMGTGENKVEGIDTKSKIITTVRIKILEGDRKGTHSHGDLVRHPVPKLMAGNKRLTWNMLGWDKLLNVDYAIISRVPKRTVDPGKLGPKNGTAFSTKGNCGSPWITFDGRVIGLHVGGDKGSNVNYCVRYDPNQGKV